MKKVLISLFTIAFLISMVNSIYAATSGSISINTSSSTIKAGEEITLTVSATDSDKLNSIEYTFITVTDANGISTPSLEVSKVEAANSNWTNLIEGTSIIYMYTGSAVESSEVFKITLKAKEDISEGNYIVNIQGLKVYNVTHAEGTDEEKTTNIGAKTVEIKAIKDTTTVDGDDSSKDIEKSTDDGKTETPSTKETGTGSKSTSGSKSSDSSSSKKLPQTGVEIISIAGIAVLSIISIISYVSYRKYKNI